MRELAGNLPVEYTAELKLDGLSVALLYQPAADGGARLVSGLTRGDGQTGEDVTSNIRTIRSVPLSISSELLQKLRLPQGAFEVRGEVVMPEKAFELLNEERERDGLPPAVNPRNAAAGTLRTLEPSIVANRRLVFFAYFLARRGRVLAAGANCNARRTRRPRLSREPAPSKGRHGRGDGQVYRRCREQARLARLRDRRRGVEG